MILFYCPSSLLYHLQVITYLAVFLPSFLPLLPVVVSCAVVVRILIKSKNRVKSHSISTASSGKPRDSTRSLRSSSIYSWFTGRSADNLNQVSPNGLEPCAEEGDTFEADGELKGAKRGASIFSFRESICDASFKMRNWVTKRKSGKADMTSNATTTMYIVTVIYLVFNVPLWVYTLFILTAKGDEDFVQWIRENALYVTIFCQRTSIVMNAACNPIVYFTRIRPLRLMFTTDNVKKQYHKVVTMSFA